MQGVGRGQRSASSELPAACTAMQGVLERGCPCQCCYRVRIKKDMYVYMVPTHLTRVATRAPSWPAGHPALPCERGLLTPGVPSTCTRRPGLVDNVHWLSGRRTCLPLFCSHDRHRSQRLRVHSGPGDDRSPPRSRVSRTPARPLPQGCRPWGPEGKRVSNPRPGPGRAAESCPVPGAQRGKSSQLEFAEQG